MYYDEELGMRVSVHVNREGTPEWLPLGVVQRVRSKVQENAAVPTTLFVLLKADPAVSFTSDPYCIRCSGKFQWSEYGTILYRCFFGKTGVVDGMLGVWFVCKESSIDNDGKAIEPSLGRSYFSTERPIFLRS